jgi:hypothetical protein
MNSVISYNKQVCIQEHAMKLYYIYKDKLYYVKCAQFILLFL